MTKKTFQAFANEISLRADNGMPAKERILMVDICKQVFSRHNPRFNKARFELACLPKKEVDI